MTMWSQNFVYFSSFLLFLTCLNVKADVHGCGGFIKSHAEIDFSKVEVNLLTKSGVSKDKVEANPSNGYYFLPVYDRGEYVIKVVPPPGWSFEPESVDINYDGETDPCTQEKDINFVFKGFGITGRVDVLGQKIGAAGLDVELVGSDKKVLRSTKTNALGIFSFTPLLPGDYVVRARHPTWFLAKSEVKVKVSTGNTVLPDGSLLVTGFNIKGRATTDGTNFGFFIYGKKGAQVKVQCDSTKQPNNAPQHKQAEFDSTPLCYTTATPSGDYEFKGANPGTYLIIPHVETGSKLYITPDSAQVVVEKDDANVLDQFKITGFSASGRVLKKSGGSGVSGAKIFLNSQEVAKTDTKGGYTLDNIKPGTYTIQVEATDLKFNDHIARIALPNPSISDIIVTGFKVCGQVVSDRSHVVSITKQGSSFTTQVPTTAGTGDWCTYLGAGKYNVEVEVSNTDRAEGIQFFPVTQSIEVGVSTITGITFSQLRATVTGKVKCLADAGQACSDLVATLKPAESEGTPYGEVTTQVKNGQYVFRNVLPGHYDISIMNHNLCWKTSSFPLIVKSAEETVPTFEQTGYSVTIIASHNTKLSYKLRAENAKSMTHDLQKSVNTFCVPQAGTYDLTYNGCHTYDPNKAPSTLSTTDHTPINVIAIKHKNGIRILSESSNVYTIQVEADGKKINDVKLREEPNKVDGYFAYRYDFDLEEGEKIKLTPMSGSMLFKPDYKELIGAGDCVDVAFNFIATKGLVLHGKTIPVIEDAKITLNFPKNPEMVAMETVTDKKGEFKFGPIDSTIDIELTAEKESYIFSAFDKSTSSFKGHKLCEIIASVKDEHGNQLSGVLLSLSGGESYRKNLITGDDGTIKFHSLSPSQYYLRPMMKEYKFEPSSKLIEVAEGGTEHVELSGRRVAFSGFGTVTTLNGEPFPNVAVLAIASDECERHQEEAISEANGLYRIRGLHPGCRYTLRVKIDRAANVDRSIPTQKEIQVGQSDVQDLNFIAMSPLSFVDVNARIMASENDYYKTLKITLYRRDSDTPIHSQRVESPLQPKSRINPGIMVFFPRIPFDYKHYYIELTSSLSEKSFKYTLPSIDFVANKSNYFFEIEFKPEIITANDEINSNSIPALFIIAIVAFVFFKQELALELLEKLWNKIQAVVKNVSNKSTKGEVRYDQPLDEREIDQLAKDINSIKRKKYVRKAN